MLNRIDSITQFLKNKIPFSPKVGIILGTGLGGLVEKIEIEQTIPYDEIPDFPLSTVEGHKGKLILGKLSNTNVIAMQGRFHFYEGYSIQEVTMPVRVMKKLGIQQLIISNASGGVNPDYEVGDLMILNDHINLIPNPLIGLNIEELGPRFPDMSEAYCSKLISSAEKISNNHNITIQKGIYWTYPFSTTI